MGTEKAGMQRRMVAQGSMVLVRHLLLHGPVVGRATRKTHHTVDVTEDPVLKVHSQKWNEVQKAVGKILKAAQKDEEKDKDEEVK